MKDPHSELYGLQSERIVMVTVNDLMRAISENRSTMKEAVALNVRVGREVFHVMSRSEWVEWLTEKVNGAKNISGIARIEDLEFPALDPELIKVVLVVFFILVSILKEKLLKKLEI